jgi:hypothetical protein
MRSAAATYAHCQEKSGCRDCEHHANHCKGVAEAIMSASRFTILPKLTAAWPVAFA